MSGEETARVNELACIYRCLTLSRARLTSLSQVKTVGADSFISKPVSSATLAEAIRDYAVEMTDDDDQNPQGQTPLDSADLDSARSEQADCLFMAAAEFDDFLREALKEFEEDIAVVEGQGGGVCFTVSDKLFAVHRLKGSLYSARLTELGDLAIQVEAELKEIKARGGGRLVSGGGSALMELRRRLDLLRQILL